jgi:hypothetical protein
MGKGSSMGKDFEKWVMRTLFVIIVGGLLGGASSVREDVQENKTDIATTKQQIVACENNNQEIKEELAKIVEKLDRLIWERGD